VLFWDTWFEHLLPGLRNETTIVYGARPRHAAAVTRLQQGMRTPRLLSRLRDPLTRRLLRHQERRHYSRLAYAGALANICAVDADSYRRHGLGCTYLPNTWPDAFGKDWSQKRSAAEAAYGSIGILGNVSSVEATGNVFGMRYLANQVLPLMDKALHGVDWTLNITGSGVLAEDLALAFQRDRVRVKGFVPSLDQEVLANSIFLLLNNAGPYTGGYTRVVYAMSSGSCLIAHRRLADSMPEVRHGENALLGESPREIAEHLARACNDGALRQRLGENARRTYEREYHPRVVTQRLLGLVKTAVHA
jgi:glycosyltransferase involved in cell wall biosynthesis